MSTTVLHKADTRGHADHGWLNAYHSLVLQAGTIQSFQFSCLA
jgi:hypothetical protein